MWVFRVLLRNRGRSDGCDANTGLGDALFLELGGMGAMICYLMVR